MRRKLCDFEIHLLVRKYIFVSTIPTFAGIYRPIHASDWIRYVSQNQIFFSFGSMYFHTRFRDKYHSTYTTIDHANQNTESSKIRADICSQCVAKLRIKKYTIPPKKSVRIVRKIHFFLTNSFIDESHFTEIFCSPHIASVYDERIVQKRTDIFKIDFEKLVPFGQNQECVRFF